VRFQAAGFGRLTLTTLQPAGQRVLYFLCHDSDRPAYFAGDPSLDFLWIFLGSVITVNIPRFRIYLCCTARVDEIHTFNVRNTLLNTWRQCQGDNVRNDASN
jgi:hypothetical protein